MARRSSTTDEIKALAEELKTPHRKKPARTAKSESETSEAAVESEVVDDATTLVRQLRDVLEDGLEDTRELTGAYPVAALSAAFLLGLVVGRLWRAA